MNISIVCTSINELCRHGVSQLLFNNFMKEMSWFDTHIIFIFLKKYLCAKLNVKDLKKPRFFQVFSTYFIIIKKHNKIFNTTSSSNNIGT